MHDTSHYDRCRTLMNVHKTHHQKRVIIFSLLALMNMYFSITLPITHNLTLLYGTAAYGLIFGFFSILYSAGILALVFFGTPEKPKLLLLSGLLTILGIILGVVNLLIGICMLIVCISQIPDSKQALWIQKQEGYPYFNERFDEQMQYFGKDYQPDHALDTPHNSEMLDMPEQGAPDFTVSPKDEMPEIPDIPDDIL
ncbi:MAG: hypothetical protein IJ644_05490 [Oscillospiraceae bacterium]|nr:hypothetical protein [Oscillospiraceae bacterium]